MYKINVHCTCMYTYMYVYVHAYMYVYLLLQRVRIGEFGNQLPVAQGSWMNEGDRLTCTCTHNKEIYDGKFTDEYFIAS